MRDVVQEILHGITGQKLFLDVPEGRPSSVTSVAVVESSDDDDGPSAGATSGAASVETDPDTTLAAAAGQSEADPTALALTAATGVLRDRSYLLAAAAGHNEWVEIVSLAGTAAVVRQPLLNDYPTTTSTLKSTRIQVNVDATFVGDESNLSDEDSTEPAYRVIWEYVVDGVTYRRQGAFDLVRYASAHHVTPLDVDANFPGWLDVVPPDYRRDQGRPLIARAWRSVRHDLRADGKLGRWVRNLDVVSELVICRANLVGVELGAMRGAATAEQLAAARDVYTQRYQQLIREPHTALATNPMGGVREARRAPLFRR